MAATIMASAGSFAAISTLFGSPVLAAFLIMEAAGIGGATLSLVALPGLLALRHRGAGLRRPGQLDRPRELLAVAHDRAAGGGPDRGHHGLGGGRRRDRRAAGLGDPPHRAVAAPGRAPQPGAGHRRPRAARRADRDGLPAGLRQQLHPGAVLRPGRPAGAGRARRRLLGGRADPADRLQDARLRCLAERLPRRPGLPLDVHRRRARRRHVRTARHEPRAGDRDGHRSHVYGDAAAAVDLDPAGHPAARRRRRLGDPAGRRRRGGGLRPDQRAAGSRSVGTVGPKDQAAAPAGR